MEHANLPSIQYEIPVQGTGLDGEFAVEGVSLQEKNAGLQGVNGIDRNQFKAPGV
ncbi:hypothetical protein DBT_0955 [Dissulfuribacter thermophilus]|uniref:Uncharacterized protein n=1 Tax=Dissulfuribacter thermophilus TaxID=1156395 RepID=A0A1B9F6Y5_9BACT|nr:hypothetical protein DBT_0955 [Dissulfuribacter thermophilus]